MTPERVENVADEGGSKTRAALKGTNLRGQTPICGFLKAKISGFLRKSTVSCENRSLRDDNKISRQRNLHFQNFIVMAFPTKNSVF